VLNHPFSHGGHPDHVARLASYWAEVFGGPTRFSDTCGGESAMLTIHSGTGAEDDLPIRFLNCFVAAIEDTDLPSDPEFRQALSNYMEWATTNVHTYSPEGSVVATDLRVPHWSWDGLQTD
jgi:hemoglobin